MVPDPGGRYTPVGFLDFETSSERIIRIELVDAVPDELLSESPEPMWVSTEVGPAAEDSMSVRPGSAWR